MRLELFVLVREAERAGLRVDDLLMTINGQPAVDGLLSNTSLSFAIELQRGEEKLSLKVPMTTLVP